MMADSKDLVSITDANQSFSCAVRPKAGNDAAAAPGEFSIRNIPPENNISYSLQLAEEDDVRTYSRRLMAKNKQAYEELAK